MLTKYHAQSRHLSVGQSLTGYPVNKEWRLLTAQSEVVESSGVVRLAEPVRSVEDRRALAVMEQTTKKLEGEDAYVSGLLWREEDPSLPYNYDMAARRLESLEKKFKNNPEVNPG